MKRFLITMIFAAVFMATSAQAANGKMYFSGNLGVSLLSDSDINRPGAFAFTGEVTYDPGFRVGGALGYDFGSFRAEGEIAYRSNDTDEGAIFGVCCGPVDGDVSALSFMANGYYDFHMASSPLVPYLGLGVGFANVTADITAPTISSLALIDDSDIVFAYQFMAGVGYNINPTTTLTVDYRYFATSDPEFPSGPAFIPGLSDIESEYSNHSFNIGVRVAF